jgi:DNA-directed RNA polymerase subunit H
MEDSARPKMIHFRGSPARALDFYQRQKWLKVIKWSRVQIPSGPSLSQCKEGFRNSRIFVIFLPVMLTMVFNVNKHTLVPKQSKLSEAEKKKLFETYRIDGKQLPRILLSDPAIASLSIKVGDVIEVQRESKTAGIALYYRVVVEG